MGVTNPSLALSGHARQFRAETLCSAKRGKGKGVRGPLPHGGWGGVPDFVLTHVLITLTICKQTQTWASGGSISQRPTSSLPPAMSVESGKYFHVA